MKNEEDKRRWQCLSSGAAEGRTAAWNEINEQSWLSRQSGERGGNQ